MIRRVVDFALNNRLLVLGFALLLFAGGIVSFERLPIEAYPDVADNYVEIITQWPGISAEQIEQQVTIPLEVVMNGIAGRASALVLIIRTLRPKADFRRRFGQRLESGTGSGTAGPGYAAAGGGAANGHGLEPGRPDLFLYLAQHESRVRPHGAQIH